MNLNVVVRDNERTATFDNNIPKKFTKWSYTAVELKSNAMHMFKERVCHILNQDLDMRKLPMFECKCNKFDFWCRLIIVDETWIYHYTRETKNIVQTVNYMLEKSQQNFFSGRKIMATVFWVPHIKIEVDEPLSKSQILLKI